MKNITFFLVAAVLSIAQAHAFSFQCRLPGAVPGSPTTLSRFFEIQSQSDGLRVQLRLGYFEAMEKLLKNSRFNLDLDLSRIHPAPRAVTAEFFIPKEDCIYEFRKENILALQCGEKDAGLISNVSVRFWPDFSPDRSESRVLNVHFNTRLLHSYEGAYGHDQTVVDLTFGLSPPTDKEYTTTRAFWIPQLCRLEKGTR